MLFSLSEYRNRQSFISSPKCGLCRLCTGCKSPSMPPKGEGRKKILLVGEAPGEREDELNEPFVGESGKFLREILHTFGIRMERDCWKTNAVLCRPPENRTPTEKEILSCRPNLLKTIQELNPNGILLLGAVSIKSLIGHLFREKVGNIGIWAGQVIPNQNPNVWIVPTYHPSYLLRIQNEAAIVLFQKHIRKLLDVCQNKPWENPPNFSEQVERIYSPSEAAKRIQVWCGKKGRFAFDFETNTLKPEREKAAVLSCSVCWWGRETIAFHWTEETKEAVEALLYSDSEKIAANLKFEERWCRHIFGKPVPNWIWDTMLAGHMLCNERGAAGLEFQSFVHLGVPDYSASVEKYLECSGKSEYNQIKKIPADELLLYNGLDSLLTYKIFQIQKKLLNHPPYVKAG